MTRSRFTRRAVLRTAALSLAPAVAYLLWTRVRTRAARAVQTPSPADPDHLDAAAAYNAATGGVSLLVMLDGAIIFEAYPNSGSPTRVSPIWSGTKSFTGVLAAAAISDGLLSWDEPISDTIAEWQGDPRRSRITVRQLLGLIGGLDAQFGGYPGFEAPPYALAIQAPAVSEPGTAFEYGPVPFQAFGELMLRKLGREPVDYLRERVLDPAGVRVGAWGQGDDGHFMLPVGASMTARGWAPFGELVRLGGRRQGEQIINQDALDECFKGSAVAPSYGLSWWLSGFAYGSRSDRMAGRAPDQAAADALPQDLVYAGGAGDQRLYVIRSLNLVIVRQTAGRANAANRRNRAPFSDAALIETLLYGEQGG